MADISKADGDGIVSNLYNILLKTINDSVGIIAQKVTSPSLDMFWALVMLSLVVFTYRSMRDRSFDVLGFGETFFRVFIFYSMITLGVVFTDFVLPMVQRFPMQLGAVMVVEGGSVSPIDTLSDQLALIWSNADASIASIEGRGITKLGRQISVGGAGFIAIVATIIFVASTFVYLVMSQIMIAILLMLFPLAAAFGYWSGSKDILQAYMRGLFWAIIIQILVFAVLGLITATFGEIFKLGADPNASSTTMLMSAALMSTLGAMMVHMTPLLANQIGAVNFNVAAIMPKSPNLQKGGSQSGSFVDRFRRRGNDRGVGKASAASANAKSRASAIVNK